MDSEERTKCNVIIHGAATACAGAGAGLAQLPGADAAAIVPIQAGMITALGLVFDIKITKSIAASALSATVATFLGRGVSQVLVGWIPGFGNALNAGTAFAITESLGWFIANRFAELDQDDCTEEVLVEILKRFKK